MSNWSYNKQYIITINNEYTYTTIILYLIASLILIDAINDVDMEYYYENINILWIFNNIFDFLYLIYLKKFSNEIQCQSKRRSYQQKCSSIKWLTLYVV